MLTLSDHVEGEAEIAERQAHFADDGVIDKHEKKELDKAHKRQLEQRGRGPAQIKAYRTGKWMSRGIKDRLPFGKDKTRERESFTYRCRGDGADYCPQRRSRLRLEPRGRGL